MKNNHVVRVPQTRRQGWLMAMLFCLATIFTPPSYSQSTGLEAQFAAYYTKINKGEAWEDASRTREHADVVVRLNETTQVEFWRGTSYLPVLVVDQTSIPFEEIVSRSGDGTTQRPDKINLFSHVKIIENTADQAIVQWRYLPNFSGGNPRETNPDLFVDEIFIFQADGTVERTVRQGTANPDAWNDPNYVIKKRYRLSTAGIEIISSLALPDSYTQPGAVSGNPEKGPNVVEPVRWWKFNAGKGTTLTESVTNNQSTILGNKVYWAAGVSGTALLLDGYNNFITVDNAPSASTSFSFEVWVALAVAPFEESGIFTQNDTGLYTNAEGELLFKVGPDEAFSEENILQGKYGKWVHIVGTKSPSEMNLYLDGQLIASGEGNNETMSGAFKLGHSPVLRAETDPYTIEGLIDEFRFYNVALTESQVQQSRENFNPGDSIISDPDVKIGLIPEGSSTGIFGARYEKLPYTERWDNLHRDSEYTDVVVEYGGNSPVKTVFWRGATYSPFHTNGAKGRFNSEFNENFGPGGPDTDCCYEPMSDKHHEFSYAHIIENTPARVVIHWRYPLALPNKAINHTDTASGWGDISDWYMYIYPDGVTAYDMRFWTNDRANFVEWSEGMILVGPGEDPRDVLPFTNTVTNADLTQTRIWDWSTNPEVLDGYSWDNDPQTIKPLIQTVNFTGSPYKAFMIYAEKNVQFWGPYINWARLTHWPVGQRTSSNEAELDGVNSRTAHYALLKTIPPEYGKPGGHHQTGTVVGGGYVTQVRLEGMTDKSLDSLRHLQQSWANAPTVSNISGLSGAYAVEQRAYIFVSSADTMSFTLNASAESPLDNPAFVIKGWGSNNQAIVTINGETSNDVQQGIVWDIDGTQTLVIYLPMTADSAQNISIGKSDVETKATYLPLITK